MEIKAGKEGGKEASKQGKKGREGGRKRERWSQKEGPGDGGRNKVKDGAFHHSLVSVLGMYCNRPFPNLFKPLPQSESWCSSFHVKMRFHLLAN